MLGTYHPNHLELCYPINYGYIEGIIAPDGEEQDAYDKPVKTFVGVVIAIIHRYDNVEEKLIVAPEGMIFTKEEIKKQIDFQEKCGFFPYRSLVMETMMGTKEQGTLNLLLNPNKKISLKFSHPETLIVKLEESVMAVVMCNDKILTTNELVYGSEKLSSPKGHVEANET